MDNIKQIVLQEMNEKRFNRKHIDGYIREFIEHDGLMLQKIDQGVKLVEKYMSTSYYASKNKRIEQLQGLSIQRLVLDIFVGIAYILHEELFTSVTAQLSSRLHFSDRTEAITTVAELVAVLCNTDVFDINKANRMASLVVVSRIKLPKKIKALIEDSTYLPPMVCVPNELTSNYSSGYLSHNESVVLGTHNHHLGDLCLDVLNIANSVAMRLDTEFLCTVEEEPSFKLDTPDKAKQWNDFKRKSYKFYSLMESQGNEFYFSHRVDKRGRIYSQGYYIHSQGNSFKKAMLELANEEVITGVPT